MKKILLIFFFPFMLQPAMAQQHEGTGLGNYTNYNKTSQSFIFRTTHGSARVTIFSPTLFKISVWESQEKELPSYAVIATPQKTRFSFTENNKAFRIKTDSLTLKINKFPLRFTFQTRMVKSLARKAKSERFG